MGYFNLGVLFMYVIGAIVCGRLFNEAGVEGRALMAASAFWPMAINEVTAGAAARRKEGQSDE